MVLEGSVESPRGGSRGKGYIGSIQNINVCPLEGEGVKIG